MAKEMDAEGLIQFGRIASGSLSRMAIHKNCANWVRLSTMAFEIVADERRARAARGWKSRSYQTTAEKRGTG